MLGVDDFTEQDDIDGRFAGIGESEGNYSRPSFPTPLSIAELRDAHPTLREPVIEGLLRRGETAGIHAKSKVGKSWLAYLIGLSVASGYYLFGRHRCRQGPVLLVDYELHPENLAHRIPTVVQAMHLQEYDINETFDVVSMRGQGGTIDTLWLFFDSLQKQYSLIILDPLYRILPGGTSENDNAAMAQVFNLIDNYAAKTGSAILFIHHQSKGDQSGKDVVDVGSGAGSIARAVDGHIVLRPHEEEGCVVMDAALRSFAPIEPVVLRWEFPLWRLDEELDPTALKKPKSARDQRQNGMDEEGRASVLSTLSGGPRTRRSIRTELSMGAKRVDRLIEQLVELEQIEAVYVETESQECFRIRGGS